MSRPNSGGKSHRRADSGGHRHQRSDSDHRVECERVRHGFHQRTESEPSAGNITENLKIRNDNNEIYTRPTSLYPLKGGGGGGEGSLFSTEPERETLKFDVNLVGAPPEVEHLVTSIKHVAEKFLYHWKTFPIILPAPVSLVDSSCVIPTDGGSLGRRPRHHLRDLFIAPSFDELDAVAVDGKGEPRRLTGKHLESVRERGLHKDKYGKPKRLNSVQLDSIRHYGEFEVESLNFPGQQHKWRLSELLQKGTERSRESLLNDLALALRFLLVTAKGRIVSHFFSVAQAIKSLLIGLLRIIDILIGVPSLQAHNLDSKLREERCKYLVAELICRPENEESLEMLCSYVRRNLRRAATEKFEVARECSQPPVAVPFKYLTPAGAELDLRLWDRGLMRRVLPTLIAILEMETRGWFLHFRERLIAELRAQKMPDEDIERNVNEAVQKEYLQRVYSSILSHPELIDLGEGITELLVQQAQAVVLMHRAVENVQRRLLKAQENVRSRLTKIHPVLSRIGPWLRARLRTAENKFGHENEWSAHEEALSLCTAQKLHQTIYFLNRDVTFMKEREPALLRELRKVQIPTRSFHWPTQIWLPNHWVVRRNFQGQSEIVPTVLSNHATSITTPRSDPSQPVFLVEKEIINTTTTRWPIWRWFNYFHRTWCWMWNAMFFFGIVLPWCSPIGLRALFSIEPFMPDLELSQVNGTLFPRKSSLTLTLCSRLLTLWRHISKSRTHFETEPDTGFIGKGFTRHINRIWNYIFKGLFGTLAIVIGFPLLCLTVTTVSLLIAFTAILWMPCLTLLVQISNAIIYDLDSPQATTNRFFLIFQAILWNIGFLGCLQPIAAIIVAFIICPIISIIILTVGIIRYWLRLLWDTTVYHILIKNRGRVPASDSFVVKRIAGPGLTSDYYFQIRPEQALAAFEAKMEWDELSCYQHVMELKILQPQKDFSNFVEACFGVFSTQLAKSGQYKILEKESQDLIGVLHEKLEKRRRDLQTGLNVGIKSKIKLTTSELKISIQQGALMLERFYPNHIFSRIGTTEETFWDNRGLSVGDWAGLAGQLYSELFSLDVLTPLDDQDTSFKLEPHPQADLSRYTDMINNAQLGVGGPDLLGAVYVPRGNIKVHSPYLEVSTFNPRSRFTTTGKISEKRLDTTIIIQKKKKTTDTLWTPWKKHITPYTPDKLLIPLPVPHPAHIAVTIYNRDTDEPIPLESEICQDILKGIEESYEFLNQNNGGIKRFRGGGGGGGGATTTTTTGIAFNDSFETSSSSIEPGDGTETEPHSTEATTDESSSPPQNSTTGTGYQWTLSDWGQRKRNNSGSVRVDLASPEDVTLDTDSTRVMFSTYGTTV